MAERNGASVLSPRLVSVLRLLLSTVNPCKMDLCNLQSLRLCKCANIMGRAVSRERESLLQSLLFALFATQLAILRSDMKIIICLLILFSEQNTLNKAGFPMMFC